MRILKKNSPKIIFNFVLYIVRVASLMTLNILKSFKINHGRLSIIKIFF